MTHFHDHKIREALVEIAPGDADAINSTKFGEISGSIEDSVREDLEILRKSPWIKESTQLVGLKYEIETGKLSVVE
jgi:carbonic anhydrase